MNRSPFGFVTFPGQFLVALLLLSHSFLLAQQPNQPIGKVDLHELNEKVCSIDPGAPAMILLNQQETELIPIADWEIKSVTKRREKIKIYSRKGFEYANIKFRLNGSKQIKITDIIGYVHYLDSAGKIVSKKIEKEDIFKNKPSESSSTLAFTFPNLVEGCVVEYAYTVSVKYSLFLPPWYFQSEIPTALATCKLTIPHLFLLQDKITSPLKIETKRDSKTYSTNDIVFIKDYTVRNIPAFKEEPFMSSILDNYQRVEFALRRGLAVSSELRDSVYDWAYENLIAKRYLESQLKKTLKGSDSLVEAARKLNSVMEKSDYLSTNLRRILKWDKSETCLPDDVDECWEQKKGSNADLNVVLLYLLKKSGVTCFPLLVSTRGNGQPDREFVNLGQFNGLDVVVVDSSENYILDLTQANLSSHITPYNILNTSAFLLDGRGGRWLEVRDNRPLSKQTMVIMSRFDSSGQINGAATTEYFDIAKDLRMKSLDKLDEQGLLKALQHEHPEILIENAYLNNPQDEQSPLTERFDFKLAVIQTNEYYYLHPGFLSELKKNPFISETRQTDVDFGTTKTLLIAFNLEMPENFAIEQLPKNITFVKSDSTISLRRISDVNGSTVRSMIRVEYKESQFPKEEYPYLKSYFDKMYELLNEPIIIQSKRK